MWEFFYEQSANMTWITYTANKNYFWTNQCRGDDRFIYAQSNFSTTFFYS